MIRTQEKKRTARAKEAASETKLSETLAYLSHVRAPGGQCIALRHIAVCRHRARCHLVLDEEVDEGEEGSEGELHDGAWPHDHRDADEEEAAAHLAELPVVALCGICGEDVLRGQVRSHPSNKDTQCAGSGSRASQLPYTKCSASLSFVCGEAPVTCSLQIPSSTSVPSNRPMG